MTRPSARMVRQPIRGNGTTRTNSAETAAKEAIAVSGLTPSSSAAGISALVVAACE